MLCACTVDQLYQWNLVKPSVPSVVPRQGGRPQFRYDYFVGHGLQTLGTLEMECTLTQTETGQPEGRPGMF